MNYVVKIYKIDGMFSCHCEDEDGNVIIPCIPESELFNTIIDLEKPNNSVYIDMTHADGSCSVIDSRAKLNDDITFKDVCMKLKDSEPCVKLIEDIRNIRHYRCYEKILKRL